MAAGGAAASIAHKQRCSRRHSGRDGAIFSSYNKKRTSKLAWCK